MSDATRPLAVDGPDAGRLGDELADAHADLEQAQGRVEAVGEATLTTLAEHHDELTALFDRYEERVTGDGNFETFIEFQGKVAAFTEELPADLHRREVFEDVDDLLQQRRLTESDWERVRETLAPVRRAVERLEERDAARERYRDARVAVERRRGALVDRIDDLERLQRLGEADLDAPTARLRDPIERYNEAAEAAFETLSREASARTLLGLLARTDHYPLVGFEPPPAELLAYVEDHEAGTEPVPQLLEYAGYSRSKLDHYVADPDALQRAVGTRKTYLRRLDADPLTVAWPPPSPGVLRYRCRELTSVLGRVVDAVDADTEVDPMVALRRVRELPRETDYERLRESAQARARLGPDERERLASGAVADELGACRAAVDRLDDALEEYPSL
jgi:hypothetical protein